MKKTARRFLSMLLVLSMVFSLLVFPAAATESEEPAAPVKATGNAAPAAKAAEDAPSAAETAEEPAVVRGRGGVESTGCIGGGGGFVCPHKDTTD